MSQRLRGNNSFTTSSTGVVWDTNAAGKSLNFKTNGVSRMEITDAGIAFAANVSPGYVLISSIASPFQIDTTTRENARFWGTAPVTAYLPLPSTTPLGSTWTVYNTTTQILTLNDYAGTLVGTLAVNEWIRCTLIDAASAVTSWAFVRQNSISPYLEYFHTCYGSWTPQFKHATSNAWVSAHTYLSQNGSYHIARNSTTTMIVTVGFTFQINAYVLNGGYVNLPAITGLPFQIIVNTAATISVASTSFASATLIASIYVSGTADSTRPTTTGYELYLTADSNFINTAGDVYAGQLSYLATAQPE